MRVFDPIKPWFISMEETGEYIGIRFGRIPPGKTEPEWIFVPHKEADGIGAFADILRKRGVTIPSLPKIKHPATPSRFSVLKTVPQFMMPQRRLKWGALDGNAKICTGTEPPSAVAWHVFDEETTTQIRRICRKSFFTVNSFLVKHLTKAIRPSLEDQSATIPWMIPVNLRGKVTRQSDIDNHSSYVSVGVRPYDTIHDVHQKIYAALERGDHWSNWYAYQSSRFLSAPIRRFLIRKEKYMAQWNIGSFSNLGDWDPEKKITQPDCVGGWIFCPPVLRVQHLGTGCITFQNRLGLLIQCHSELTASPAVPKDWMQKWVREIEIDLASFFAQS